MVSAPVEHRNGSDGRFQAVLARLRYEGPPFDGLKRRSWRNCVRSPRDHGVVTCRSSSNTSPTTTRSSKLWYTRLTTPAFQSKTQPEHVVVEWVRTRGDHAILRWDPPENHDASARPVPVPLRSELKTSHLHVTHEGEPVQFSLDGEMIETNELSIHSRPGAMQFFVSDDYDPSPEEWSKPPPQ